VQGSIIVLRSQFPAKFSTIHKVTIANKKNISISRKSHIDVIDYLLNKAQSPINFNKYPVLSSNLES